MSRLRARARVALRVFALAVLFTLHASPTAAAPARIALIGRRSDDPVVPRLRAELEALGFEVAEVADGGEPPGRDSLEVTARAEGAIAAMRLVPSGGGVEVWILDRITGKTVLRDVVEPDATETEQHAIVAVRAVELLRASLLEIRSPHPLRGEVAPPPVAHAAAALPVEPRLERFALFGGELAGAALISPGGVPPAAAVVASVYGMPTVHFGVQAIVAVSVAPTELQGSEGSATVSAGLAGGGVRIVPGSPRSRWVPALALGLAAAWVDTRGTATAPYRSSTAGAVSAAPYARADIGVVVTEHLQARLGVLGGAMLQPTAIAFAGREVARWGRPFFAPSLGLDFSWP